MRHFQNILTKQTTAIAVDFAADALRCIAIEQAVDGTWTRRVAFELPSAPLDRSMDDSALREFSAKVSEAGLTGCKCRVTIASHLFRMEMAQLTSISENELPKIAHFEAIGRFNVNEADVMIQHASLPCKTAGKSALLLMAVPLLIIRNATQAVMAAGLSPCSIENAACAALHGAELRHDGFNTGLIAFMHIEPQQAVLLLMKDGQLQSVRAMQGDWAVAAPSTEVATNTNDNSLALEPVASEGAWRWSSLAEETLRCMRQACVESSLPTRMLVTGAPSSDHELLETFKGVCGLESVSLNSAGWSTGAERLTSDTWAAALGAASLDFKIFLQRGQHDSSSHGFLPNDSRRAVNAVRAKRRIALLGILLLVFSVGVSAHSWNSARLADSERAVGAMLVANAPGVDEILDGLAKEQSTLSRALRVTDGLMPAISASSVVATITNMLPEHVTLTGMRLETTDTPKQMIVVLNGMAATNKDLVEFEQKLAGTNAFRGVTVSENKVGEFMGKRVEDFTVSLQVPLCVQVCKPGTMRVAKAGVN